MELNTVKGDEGALPSKGTTTGMEGAEAYGFDLGQDATNSRGKISSQTQSDPIEEDEGIDQNWPDADDKG